MDLAIFFLPVKLILLISALLSLSTTARAFELKGTIKSEDGAYQENSKEAATVFDRMLDAVCFNESAVKW